MAWHDLGWDVSTEGFGPLCCLHWQSWQAGARSGPVECDRLSFGEAGIGLIRADDLSAEPYGLSAGFFGIQMRQGAQG